MRFETPTATITVRGTNVKVAVKPNGDSIIGLDEGEVTLIPKGKGEPAHLIKGQGAQVTASGVEVVDQVLAVADPIVDRGWSQATDFGRDRDRNQRDCPATSLEAAILRGKHVRQADFAAAAPCRLLLVGGWAPSRSGRPPGRWR